MSRPQTRRWSNDQRPNTKQYKPKSFGFKTSCLVICLFLIYWGSLLFVPGFGH